MGITVSGKTAPFLIKRRRSKIDKKAKELLQKIDKNRMCDEDAALIKVICICKIDESVDIAVRGNRSKESESNGRGVAHYLMELVKMLKY
jgi:hypothetical protein